MLGTKPLAGVLAAAAVVAALSACGSSPDKTLDQADAQNLNAKAVAVQNAVEAGNCENAQVAAQDFVNAVNQLPDTATTDTKNALREAGDSLKSLASDPTQCQQAGATGVGGAQPTTTTTPPPTTSTPATTTTTSTTSTTTTKEAPPPENGNGNGNEGSGGGDQTSSGVGAGSSGDGNSSSGGGTGDTGGTGAGGIGKR